MTIQSALQIIAIAAIPLIFAITLHEVAHGWIANKLGDRTALMLGRITLNPAKHIDIFGTIILPVILLLLGGFIFGWAKPVPVTWQNLKHPRRDMAIVAIAGPAANLLMALLWAMIAKLAFILAANNITQVWLNNAMTFIQLTALFGITINCILMLLNLLPIPPLDGSRVVTSLLPPRLSYYYERIEPFGIWILLGLLVLGILGSLLKPPIFGLVTLIRSSFGLPT